MGRNVEEELRVRARQQAVVAELGLRALAGTDPAALMDEAVELVAETLHVEYSKVLELLPDGDALLLRAGVGWQAGLVGQATVSAGLESQAGYTLVSHEPVIVEDLSTETRFSGPPLLHDHGVVSGISVIIQGECRPFGVMAAHTTSRRTFTRDDIHFLQAVANVLAEAIQRKWAEQALRESEERFRALTERALAGVYLIQDGRFRYVNPALATMFGYTPEELIGRLGPLDLTGPDDRERVAENIRRRVAGEVESLHYTFQGLRKDGTLFECEVLGSHGEYNGRPAILGMLLDITERKRAEAKQAHFQNLLRAISEVNQLIVREKDSQAMLQEACQILQRTRGYAGLWIGLLDEAGQHLRQVAGAGIAADAGPVELSLDEPAPLLYCARTALAECRPYLVEDVEQSPPCVICPYQGWVPHADALAVPLRYRERCRGVLVVYIERPRAFDEDETQLLSEMANDLALGLHTLEEEKKLRESEARYRAIVTSEPECVKLLAEDGTVLEMNPAGLAMVEADSRDQVEGKSAYLLVAPEYRSAFEEFTARIFRGEGDVMEFEIVGLKGARRWLESHAVPLRNVEGEVTALLAVTRDITERKRAEAALKEYSERLAEMVEDRTRELRGAQEQLVRQEKLAVLGQLAGSVAHELRNPLGAISNAVYYLQMILSDADETIRDYLGMIAAEVHNSEKIISDLLDFSRIQPAMRQQVSVPDLIAGVLEKHPAPEKVEVVTHIPADLPPALVDGRQIGQVLGNLLTNAYQAMPEGGRLTISAEVSGDQSPISNLQSLDRDRSPISIFVTDTGAGIPPEDLDKVFEPLFTTKARGIGLGLAISRNLVEANGGAIGVESEVGQGSTFTVRLPVT